ncbi:MAG TPA: hypothetical protein VFX73_04810 [Chitinophagaceae bacterium]|nr:hypothetical protein [Chitinophagaceae bacterium]
MLKGAARPIILLFIILNAFIIVFRRSLTSEGFSVDMLIIGNIILFGITLVSFILLSKGMKASSTPAFLRSIYGSFMIKFFIVAVSVFGYAFFAKADLNKPGLFTLMFLYLVYTFFEIKTLMKLSRKGNTNV